MKTEPTYEDIKAGVTCELEHMRTQALEYFYRAYTAMANVTAHTSDNETMASLVESARLSGFAAAMHLMSAKGGHTENVWYGRVHQHLRESGEPVNGRLP